MSRIVVKNLPAQTTEEDLRKLFSEKGTLTDVDLKRNSSGKSRHFAFIGYHDDRAAVQAIITLNNTFLRTNKIQVERCRNLSKEDPVPSKKKEYENIPRSQAKKRMSLQSNVGKPNKKLKKEHFGPTLVEDILVEKYKSDPKFADFLDLKCAGQAAKVRERLNLVVDSSDSESSNPPLNSESKVKLPAQERTLRRGEVINWLHQVKVSGIPRRTNKMMIKEFFAPLDCRSIRRRGRGSKAAYVGFLTESECKQAFFKHKCYLNGKCVRISKYDGDFKMEKTADGGLPTLRIYFYDFPATTTAKEIQKLFSAQGKLKTLVIAKDEDTNKLKNFGLATYQKKSDAGKAYKKLLKSQFKVVLCPDWSAEVPTENLEECLKMLSESVEEDNESMNKTGDSSKSKKWQNQEDALKNEESIAESGRLFLRNLSYTTQEADIEKLFGTYGPISEINLPIDYDTKQLKGFGIVTYLMPEHAVKAFTELDGTILHGRMLHLLPGKSKDTPDLEDSSNYKDKKLNKQKAQAGKSLNWNALFVDHNAVAEVVAEKFGTSKEAILGPQVKGSAAVRLALAETQIVNETKKYLEQMGVRLESFNDKGGVKRSKTVILVKNLPSQTKSKELKEIFKKHGQLGRIILPPSGLTAIVEFLDPSEARKAFTGLAYSKFKHLPLYLEWAPEGSLENKEVEEVTDEKQIEKGNDEEENSIDRDESHNANSNDNITVGKKCLNVEIENEMNEKLPKGEPEPETTLFVKNLNFQTRNDALRMHFDQIGPLHYAYVVTKKASTSEDALELSRGYGFVRYMLKSDADRALDQLQQSTLDGKCLEIARSDRAEKGDSQKETQNIGKQSKLKLIVKNVPFAAKTKEVVEIFRTFGGLKRVKLPKKLGSETNRHRGFAFVEFCNESDAKGAFEALHLSTHLLGRRLVLEWANDDEDVDEIRKKMEEHYAPPKKTESKKSVFKIN